jgi:hypothetical protein
MSDYSKDLSSVYGEIPFSYKEGFFTRLHKCSDKVINVNSSILFAYITVDKYIEEFGDVEKFIWDRQRPIDKQRVIEMRDYFDNKKDFLKQTNQIVTFAMVGNEDPKIIDGQHRLSAILGMDSGFGFLIQCINFDSEEERFLEFIKVNSNTPLPDYYKCITDHDSYCKTLSDNIAAAIEKKYRHLFRENKQYGYIKRDTLAPKICKKIKKRKIDISPYIVQLTENFIVLLEDKKIFPHTEVKYSLPKICPDKCQAYKSINSAFQCMHDKKGDTPYCGVHKNSSVKYYGRRERNERWEKLKEIGSGYFVLNSKWLTIVIDELFPLINSI